MVRRMILIIAGLALLAGGIPLAPPARAEESGPGLDAGMIFPIEGDSVRLIVAHVNIVVPRDDAPGRVVSFYRLRNLGGATVSLAVGFVRGGAGRSAARDTLVMQVDHRPLPYRMESASKIPRRELLPELPDSLPVWRFTIPPFATADVDLTYGVAWSFASDDEEMSRELAFHASPATLWSGPLDDLAVSFVFDELTATLLRCPAEEKAEDKMEGAKEGAKGKAEEKAEAGPKAPCVESRISPTGYEWYARGPGWRFRDGRFPADFRIRFSWAEEEEND